MLRNILAGLAFFCAGAMSVQFATAQTAEEIYKDRTVTILVGYGAGGTYGRTSLLLAEHMGKVIPGKPTIVVQHMPGAGGIKAANYFYNVAPRNGLVLLMPPEMSVVSELLRPKTVKYRTREFTWLGRVFGQNSTLVVRRDSGVRTLNDITKKQVVVASSGKGSPTYLIPATLNALYGAKLKIVVGYRGSRKMQLAVEQGEVQGLSVGWQSWISAKPEWFKGGDKSFALPLVQNGYTPRKEIANVPMLRDVMKTKEDKAVARMLGSASVLGRGLVLPPHAPHQLVKPLRAAFDTVIVDKSFVADALKRGLLVNPIRGAEIQKMINELMDMPASTVKRAREVIFGKSKAS